MFVAKYAPTSHTTNELGNNKPCHTESDDRQYLNGM